MSLAQDGESGGRGGCEFVDPGRGILYRYRVVNSNNDVPGQTADRDRVIVQG